MAYVERKRAVQIIDNYAKTVTEDGKVIVDAIRDIVAVITPTADVAEVKHGEWIKTDKGQKCSSCNCLSSLANANLKSVYCPWCGAKMGHDIKEKR